MINLQANKQASREVASDKKHMEDSFDLTESIAAQENEKLSILQTKERQSLLFLRRKFFNRN